LKPLLVVIPDNLSDLIRKGEVTSRYYNPGNLFDRVHLLLTNDDQPEPTAVQKMVGNAELHLHNLPLPSPYRTLGWLPCFLKAWEAAGLELGRRIQPQLLRAYGNAQNGYLAAKIKKDLGVPLVMSLHGNPDVERRRNPWWPRWKRRLMLQRMLAFERESLAAADWVLPVYESLRGYAQRRGAKRIEVYYNVINPDNLRVKNSYCLHSPRRLISVSRQFEGKNPVNLLRSVARLPDVELTLVGDGPYHERLQDEVRACGIGNRTKFFRAIPNDQLCRMLPDFDFFAAHTDYWEISKAVLEPLLTGLPVVLNRQVKDPVPEFRGDIMLLVENSPEGYYEALRKLIQDDSFREELGRKAHAHAMAHWDPVKTEEKFVEIYKQAIRI
jgi:glycosyltransferase involved in cell wall biosynthesis